MQVVSAGPLPMRWLISLLGSCGGVAAGTLGLRWLQEVARRQIALGPAAAVDHPTVLLSVAAYALLGAMVAALLGAVLAWRGRGHTAGTLLLVAGLVPGILDLRAFLVTCVLILAGMLAYGLPGRSPDDRGRLSMTSTG